MDDDFQILEAASAIRRYLAAHPGAGDTDVGVHAWWVGWVGVEPPLQVTQAALVRLEHDGEARCVHGIWQRAAQP